MRHAVVQLVKALCYKPEGRGFESGGLCHRMALAGLSYLVQIEWSGASFVINVNFKGTSVK